MKKLKPIDYNNQRIITTTLIAESYSTTVDTIIKNFNRNKIKYQEGKHYYLLQGKELKEFKATGQIDLSPCINKLYLWTEKGALLHAKSLNTDKAWEVYDMLVEHYFRQPINSLSPMEMLKLQFQVIEEHGEQIKEVVADVKDFKENSPLFNVECDELIRTVKSVGTRVLGGKGSKAYNDKSLRAKVYADIHAEIRRQFQVRSYKAIKRCNLDKAICLLNNYKLPIALKEEVILLNNQTYMEVS